MNLEIKDHSVSGEQFTLRYDQEKHMFFTEPKPSLEQLPSYYESEDYISHTDGSSGLFEKMYQFVKMITLSRKQKLLQKYAKQKGSLLDIGAGTGDFLEYCKKKGWKIDGVEPNEKARALALSKDIELNEDLPTKTKQYDAITMWHVLEHVYDLEKQIQWLKKHLAKEGHIYIAVPNFESYDAQYYKDFWAAYDVPRHLYHFSEKAIKLLFKEEGLHLIKTLPMKFDSYYVSLLSEKYKSGSMNFLSAFTTGWKSNRRASKKGGYSSQIYVLKHKKTQN